MVKNPPANAGDTRDVDLIPRLGKSPEGRNGNPLQYSCLENPTDTGPSWSTVHGAAKELDMIKCVLAHTSNTLFFLCGDALLG